MTTIITKHFGAKASNQSPIINVSDTEILLSKLGSISAWWRPDTRFNPTIQNGAWLDRINDIPLTLRNGQWPIRNIGMNEMPYLQFTRANNTILKTPIESNLWPIDRKPWTFAWIGQPSQDSSYAGNEGVFGNAQAGTGEFPSAVFYQGNSAAKPIWVREANSPVTSTIAGFPFETGPNLVIVQRNPNGDPGDRSAIYVDNVKAETGSDGNPNNTNSHLLIGGNMREGGTSLTNASFGGRIYDLFVFNSYLSSNERALLSEYANQRYNMGI